MKIRFKTKRVFRVQKTALRGLRETKLRKKRISLGNIVKKFKIYEVRFGSQL